MTKLLKTVNAGIHNKSVEDEDINEARLSLYRTIFLFVIKDSLVSELVN